MNEWTQLPRVVSLTHRPHRAPLFSPVTSTVRFACAAGVRGAAAGVCATDARLRVARDPGVRRMPAGAFLLGRDAVVDLGVLRDPAALEAFSSLPCFVNFVSHWVLALWHVFAFHYSSRHYELLTECRCWHIAHLQFRFVGDNVNSSTSLADRHGIHLP